MRTIDESGWVPRELAGRRDGQREAAAVFLVSSRRGHKAARRNTRCRTRESRPRFGWFGNGKNLRAYHTWLLTPRGRNETETVSEEVAFAPGGQMLAPTNPGQMHRGHDLW